MGRFRLDTGALVDVLQADLPQVPSRRSEPYNPGGTIAAVDGAIGGRLILADPEAQIVVLY